MTKQKDSKGLRKETVKDLDRKMAVGARLCDSRASCKGKEEGFPRPIGSRRRVCDRDTL